MKLVAFLMLTNNNELDKSVHAENLGLKVIEFQLLMNKHDEQTSINKQTIFEYNQMNAIQ